MRASRTKSGQIAGRLCQEVWILAGGFGPSPRAWGERYHAMTLLGYAVRTIPTRVGRTGSERSGPRQVSRTIPTRVGRTRLALADVLT